MKIIICIIVCALALQIQCASRNNQKNIILNSAKMPSNKDFDKEAIYKANENVQYKIKDKFWRDQLYFTQGLSFINKNTLLESSGLHGQSVLQEIKLDTNNVEVQKQNSLPKEYFGEGSDIIKINGQKQLVMLTWQQRQIFVYDDKMKLQGTYSLPYEINEGWGLTHYTNDEGKLILLVSDGSHKLFHVDPEQFKVIKTVEVFYNNGIPVKRLNELEFYKGNVLANVWGFNYILEIDYNTGDIIQNFDFSEITNNLNNSKDFKNYSLNTRDFCLNGIAYHENSNRLILTGKKWPWFYEIEFQ